MPRFTSDTGTDAHTHLLNERLRIFQLFLHPLDIRQVCFFRPSFHLLLRCARGCPSAVRQYLYFCTSKASKLSTCGLPLRRLVRDIRRRVPHLSSNTSSKEHQYK